MRAFTALLIVALGLPALGKAPVPEVLPGKDYEDVLVRIGNIYVSGQPSEAGLAALRDKGVMTVVNLRTAEEMAGKTGPGFDEAETARALGMAYVSLPAGGDANPYSPVTLEKFAAIADAAEGGVLLHCKSATRATHLWVAYLVKHKGLSMEQALAQGRLMNFGQLPLEGFMGEGFRYTYEVRPE
ncbi:MAG: beta-lactamase hydrolase domain-containing protein [Pseudomonadota bacterium]